MRNLFTILFLFILIAITARAQQDASLTVISNNKGAPSELRMNALRSVLKGERQRWSDGTKVTVALMKTDTPIGTVTCKKIFNMSGGELSKFYLSLEFAGKGQSPNMFDSVDALEAFVARTPGAIGVIAGPYANNSIKEITIEGKKTL